MVHPAKSVTRALLILAACAIGAAAAYVIVPEASPWLPRCVFRSFTGLYCPGCGATRCLHALSHGQILQALSFNPLIVLIIPAMLYELARQIASDLTGRAILPGIRVSARATWFVSAAIILFWIARNLPYYPFMYLSPR